MQETNDEKIKRFQRKNYSKIRKLNKKKSFSMTHDRLILKQNTRELLARKIQAEKWPRHSEVEEKWSTKVVEKLSLYRDVCMAILQLDELIHYITAEEMQKGIVPNKSEHEHVKKLYKQRELERQSKPKPNPKKLQSPDTTYGEVLQTRICKKCRKSETTFQARQKRSADEPTTYFFQCKDTINCKFSWHE